MVTARKADVWKNAAAQRYQLPGPAGVVPIPADAVCYLGMTSALAKQKCIHFTMLMFPYLQCRDWLGEPDKPLEGFPWKSGSDAHTEGIVFWSHLFRATTADKKEVAVLLVDTQGSFGTGSSTAESVHICALSVLISSIQVFNVMRNLQLDHLQHLQPSEGAETADGALRRRVDGPVAIRLTKRPPEQRPCRKTENGRRGKAQAAFQCPAFPESWGHIEVVSTPGSVIVAGLPVPLPIPKRSGSSTVDQDGGSHPPAAWTRLQASNTWHPVAECGPKLRTRADKQFASRHRLSDTARATWPSFKQAVGVVVINGVGLPDTRNHEAEFPEGAGSPLPILGERAFGTP
ncbi:hypothetical protein HPB47_003697 [Ixodes persulcatus]|uniref:Uncharacterized protein n=1 Tax=Ixodes persulcatus TaxID=34615 RepID=A0AC60PIW5_IXOPE|nr:hypothetical protein HPB47_003697 [Ixodes persulcatus]